mmetsp:Transcript_52259/g.78066  ORF Transcript_52259/g.78066 Transcript_52259/m.78066 type:complete len:85 (+) Transcript_52259:380-634(+)
MGLLSWLAGRTVICTGFTEGKVLLCLLGMGRKIAVDGNLNLTLSARTWILTSVLPAVWGGFRLLKIGDGNTGDALTFGDVNDGL